MNQIAHRADFEECKTAEGVTDDEMRSMRDPTVNKTRAMKCFVTCLAEKCGKVRNWKKIFTLISNLSHR